MVLTGVREDQIENCLAGLSLDEIDVLIKYVYKGLGMPRNNGPLFKWHAKVRWGLGECFHGRQVFQAAGVGGG